MSVKHVVVDGSNIATEGRTAPSLEQLNEAVTTFLAQHPHEKLTVVVDATFGHRIDPSEKEIYEEALLAGELVCPPAGAVGRGDAFVLQIADTADAIVLSNDSFQEFHGSYEWLFEEGRLIGGKPVPEVGWVFVDRTPVRGPMSRRSTRDGRGARRSSRRSEPSSGGRRRTTKSVPLSDEPLVPKSPPPGRGRGRGRGRGGAGGRGGQGDQVTEAPPDRTGEGGRRSRGRGGKKPEPVNEALPFIEFVAAHPLGSLVEGEVDEFSSHGAYAKVEGARGYAPLKFLGDPAPRSAREVLEMGATRSFVVQAIDVPRRGIDLALPGFEDRDAIEQAAPDANAADVEAELADDLAAEAGEAVTDEPPARAAATKRTAGTKKAKKAPAEKAPARKRPPKKAAADQERAEAVAAPHSEEATDEAPAKRAAKKAPVKKAPAKKAPAKKAATKKAPAREVATKKAPLKKAPAKKAASKKAPAKAAATKKAATKKAPAKKGTGKQPAKKKAPAKKATGKQAAKNKATAKKAATKKAGPVTKAPKRPSG